jgi:hypothetical protein
MAARLNRAALRLLSARHTYAGRQLVRLHGMGNRSPTHPGGSVHAPESRHVVWLVPWSEAETRRANEQLVVRGGDLSKGVPLVGN